LETSIHERRADTRPTDPISRLPAWIGSRPCVLAAWLHHHVAGRPWSRCSIGRERQDASGADDAGSRRAHDDADIPENWIRWAALFNCAVRCAARSHRYRSGELRNWARLAAPDQLAARSRGADDQAAARLPAVHVRRDVAGQT